MRRPGRSWIPGAVVVGAALLISPLRSGYLLVNDSVAVPEQDLLPWMVGAGTAPPRSVPQDALVAVLDDVVPGWIVQRALVLAGLLLLGFGVMRLLRGRTAIDRVCAALLAMWSTYVFERMAMGHWGLLLGVAVLPWLLDALADARAGVRGAAPRAVLWAGLGSIVPTAGALQLAATVAVLGWPGRRAWRPSLLAGFGVLAVQAVWVIPGILRPGTSGGVGSAFGLEAEGPAGPVLTALGTGGIWNTSAAPGSRSGWLAIAAPVVLLTLAILGAAALRRMRRTWLGPLVLLSGLGLAWALATAAPALQGLVTAVESVPGGGLLRDAQKWLAPWLVLLALAGGLGLGRLAGRARGSDARVPAAILAALVPIVLLPDLALGLAGRLTPVRYPDEWSQVREELEASSAPGDVVSLPWSAFRAYAWNDRRTVLDPAPRYLPRTVVTDSRLLVASGGDLTVVPADDPRSRQVELALRSADPAAGLAAAGIGFVLLQRDQPGTPGHQERLPEGILASSRVVAATPTLELRQLQLPPDQPAAAPTWPVATAWLLAAGALLAAAAALAVQRVAGLPSIDGRSRRRVW
ncbi:MAG: DUF3367 domain-containing protein [Candidatus Nanopelagicales bacterium]|jgi:hypothetical protein|nr:DUF3367 domain-containing protein [Candidatus Nanopelagicales bacterium]